MKVIKSNAEFRQLCNAGRGLIYNDFSGRGPKGKDYNVLHAASCSWLARSNLNVRKIFFSTVEEAISWLQMNRGKEGKSWRRCNTCQADATVGASPQESYTTYLDVKSPAFTPFTEREAEDILVQYLNSNGFRVRRQVRTPSGIVDVIADSQEEHWIIEVKGEDRGGYTSAEMNFQIGVGQIASRMTNSAIRYALAFPATGDFKRVLRKYKGSEGFERLSLNFFVIHQNAKVDKYSPSAMKDYIERER